MNVLRVPPQFLTCGARQGGRIHTCWPEHVSVLHFLVQKPVCCCSTSCLACCDSLTTNDSQKKKKEKKKASCEI